MIYTYSPSKPNYIHCEIIRFEGNVRICEIMRNKLQMY